MVTIVLDDGLTAEMVCLYGDLTVQGKIDERFQCTCSQRHVGLKHQRKEFGCSNGRLAGA